MNNLRRFNTEAEYKQASLNYPAVSWVVSGDTVHFDKTEAPNDKIMAAFTYDSVGEEATIIAYNYQGSSPSTYFSSLTFNDVAVEPITDGVYIAPQPDTVYTYKYGITTTTINDCFAIEIGMASSCVLKTFEFLIPTKITSVDSFPLNQLDALVIEGARVLPITSEMTSTIQLAGNIYVPDDVVNAYKADSNWIAFAESIHPISEYSGNLPV